MERRKLLTHLAQGALGATAIAGCTSQTGSPGAIAPEDALGKASGKASEQASGNAAPSLTWQMATSWPLSLDTIYGGAQVLSERVAAMTGGRFKIEPRAAGEVAPGTEVLNVVSQGAVPCGHSAAYYYIGKSPAVAFGTTVPFGLNAQQQNAWLYDGGGLEQLQALYAKKFNVIQFPCGNTGVQMGGWFRKEIKSLTDLKGLKMRIPGLGGQVMSKLGVTVQVLPGGEIFQALQTGAIDAAEWVGPYDDEKLGLHKVAKYYYYPGWWEPGPSLELQINLDEWKKLPLEYQEIIKSAAFESNLTMLSRYEARNNEALQRLKAAGIELRTYSPEILGAAEKAAFELYEEFSAKDADFKAIYEPWKAFRDRVFTWNNLNESSYTQFVYGTMK